MSKVRVPAGMSAARGAYLLGGLPTFERAVLALDPTNYWPANAGAGAIADVADGAPVVMNGSQSWVAPTVRSQGWALDWTDSTTAYPSFSLMMERADFTWQVAAQFDSVTTVGMLHGNTDQGYWQLDSGSVARIQLEGTIAISPTIVTGTWYLLHLARSGSTYTMYINGAAAGTRSGTASFNVNNFGRYHVGGNGMDGRMNHFARWSGRALTATEIAKLGSKWAA